jgi:hypothetical protein
MEFFSTPERAPESFVSQPVMPMMTSRPKFNAGNPQSETPAFWTVAELLPGFCSKNLNMEAEV